MKFEKPVLNDKEREFLKKQINLLEDYFDFEPEAICKGKIEGIHPREYVCVAGKRYGNVDTIFSPTFRVGEMFKNLELEKDYSLEELGLT